MPERITAESYSSCIFSFIRNSLSGSTFSRFFPCFSFFLKSFIVLHSSLWSILSYFLYKIWGLGWSSFFALWMSRYICIICCEDYLSFTELLLHFCQKSLGIFVWVSFWVLCYLVKYWIALHLWNKSWYMLIFIYCGIMFASIFWRIFCICIHEGHQSVLAILSLSDCDIIILAL